MIRVWRGYHGPELVSLIEQAWNQNQLLILVSPSLQDFSFLNYFRTDCEFKGDWAGIDTTKWLAQPVAASQMLEMQQIEKAVIGVFTSGTQSGSPRLVLYSKENILSSLTGIRQLFETEKIKKIFCYPQPTHTFGLILGYVHSFLFGARLVQPAGAYSRNFHQTWEQSADKSTLTLGTPTHFLDLINWCTLNKIVVKPSYSAIVGGASVSQGLWDRLQNELKIQKPSIGFGATEAAPGISHLAPGLRPAFDGDIGQVLPGVDLSIGPDSIEFSGPNLCYAYFEQNRIHFPQRVRLNDLLTQNQSRLIFLGRSDLVVNRGGLKISLERIENLVQSHFLIKCVAVEMFDSRLGGEVFLLLQSDSNIDLSVVKEHLAQHEVPIKLENIFQDVIPLNSNSKFDRKLSKVLLLKKMNLKFPIPVKLIFDQLPHRHSAIWLDEIIETKPKYGRGLVRFDSSRPYSSEGVLRKSSCIEFVAQCYGYAAITNDILDIEAATSVEKTLIVEVKNCVFTENENDFRFADQEEIIAEAWCTHTFGQLKVIKGQVMAKGKTLATLDLKAYVS